MGSMTLFRYDRVAWLLFFLLVFGMILCVSVKPSKAQSDSDATLRTEQIEQLLQQADSAFEKKEFIAGYELYRRVLSLDSTNQHARSKIYETARVYQAMEKIARDEKNEEQAQLLYQQYRGIVRYLLSVLTEQLNAEFQIYSKLNLSKETGVDITEQVIPVLQNLINILTELKAIYEQFPREEAGTETVIERLKNAVLKYEEELASYQGEL